MSEVSRDEFSCGLLRRWHKMALKELPINLKYKDLVTSQWDKLKSKLTIEVCLEK